MDPLSLLESKKILILGFGVENQALTRFLLNQGLELTVADQKTESELSDSFDGLITPQLTLRLGEDYLRAAEDYDIVFRTPGISLSTPELVKARERGAHISSQMQLFMDLCPTPNIIGITGTKGKGTTSTLIRNILKKDGRKVKLGGNIGLPPITFVDELKEDDWVVLELSSFQLQDLDAQFKVAVTLMITSEHLDYHADTEEYVQAKLQLVKNQSEDDFAVINVDYPNSKRALSETKAKIIEVSGRRKLPHGAFVDQEELMFADPIVESVLDLTQVQLKGKHNWENIAAAAAATKVLGISSDTIAKAAYEFHGLEHRLELVVMKNNIQYYDDSFSTTPETSIAAINAFEEPISLILGGSSKNSDFTELADVIINKPNIRAVILIGSEAPVIKAALAKAGTFKGRLIEGMQTMTDIVTTATHQIPNGGVVLLSPACASFDMFDNYKDRGEKFKTAVHGL